MRTSSVRGLDQCPPTLFTTAAACTADVPDGSRRQTLGPSYEGDTAACQFLRGASARAAFPSTSSRNPLPDRRSLRRVRTLSAASAATSSRSACSFGQGSWSIVSRCMALSPGWRSWEWIPIFRRAPGYPGHRIRSSIGSPLTLADDYGGFNQLGTQPAKDCRGVERTA